jgi:hypothetical protein
MNGGKPRSAPETPEPAGLAAGGLFFLMCMRLWLRRHEWSSRE